MWPKLFAIAIPAITFPLIFASVVRAELASGSVLNIASQGVGVVPDRKVTIELEENNRLVFRSGQTGRFLPTANQGSQLTLGLGSDRQVSILPSSATFANAYADTRTIIQDLPLNSLGVFQGEIPGFIQNIWLKTTGGAREMVNFTLFSVNYNAQTGQGEMSGAFINADGKEQFANGAFNLDPTDGCACNYTMQLEVQSIANGGGGPPGGGVPGGGVPGGGVPGGGGPPGGGVPPGPIGGSTGGGIGGAFPFPLLALAALPFLGNDDGNQTAPTPIATNPVGNAPDNTPNNPPGDTPNNPPGDTPNNPPTGGPNGDQPPNPPSNVPTPALLPGLMGLAWKARQRRRQVQA
jgi:hypothetical protein